MMDYLAKSRISMYCTKVRFFSIAFWHSSYFQLNSCNTKYNVSAISVSNLKQCETWERDSCTCLSGFESAKGALLANGPMKYRYMTRDLSVRPQLSPPTFIHSFGDLYRSSESYRVCISKDTDAALHGAARNAAH